MSFQLNNFAPGKFTYRGESFGTAEHAYHAEKYRTWADTLDAAAATEGNKKHEELADYLRDVAEQIKAVKGPQNAKDMADTHEADVPDFVLYKWSTRYKVRRMRDVLNAKLRSDNDACQKATYVLLEVVPEGHVIAESVKGLNSFWGVNNKTYTGDNKLGELFAELRQTLKDEHFTPSAVAKCNVQLALLRKAKASVEEISAKQSEIADLSLAPVPEQDVAPAPVSSRDLPPKKRKSVESSGESPTERPKRKIARSLKSPPAGSSGPGPADDGLALRQTVESNKGGGKGGGKGVVADEPRTLYSRTATKQRLSQAGGELLAAYKAYGDSEASYSRLSRQLEAATAKAEAAAERLATAEVVLTTKSGTSRQKKEVTSARRALATSQKAKAASELEHSRVTSDNAARRAALEKEIATETADGLDPPQLWELSNLALGEDSDKEGDFDDVEF